MPYHVLKVKAMRCEIWLNVKCIHSLILKPQGPINRSVSNALTKSTDPIAILFYSHSILDVDEIVLCRCRFPSVFETSVNFDVAYCVCACLFLSIFPTLSRWLLLRRLTNFDKISDVIRDRGVHADGGFRREWTQWCNPTQIRFARSEQA